MHQPHSSRRFPFPRSRLFLALLPFLLPACTGAAAQPGDPVGEWAGTLVAGQGVCPDHAPSRLLVDRTEISFIPAGGVLVLHGVRKPGATRLHAQLLLTDMNRKPLPMVFEGSLAPGGARIDGTYGTPSCRAHVTLMRPESHPFQRFMGK